VAVAVVIAIAVAVAPLVVIPEGDLLLLVLEAPSTNSNRLFKIPLQ
jgi:hypothetical protein